MDRCCKLQIMKNSILCFGVKRALKAASFSIFNFFLFSSLTLAQTPDVLVKDQNVIWGFDFLPSGEILFTERSGNVKIYDLKNKKLSLVINKFEVAKVGQGGAFGFTSPSKF